MVSGSGGSTTLAGDSDVAISSPANAQVLTYNSGAGKWENQTPASVPVTSVKPSLSMLLLPLAAGLE